MELVIGNIYRSRAIHDSPGIQFLTCIGCCGQSNGFTGCCFGLVGSNFTTIYFVKSDFVGLSGKGGSYGNIGSRHLEGIHAISSSDGFLLGSCNAIDQLGVGILNNCSIFLALRSYIQSDGIALERFLNISFNLAMLCLSNSDGKLLCKHYIDLNIRGLNIVGIGAVSIGSNLFIVDLHGLNRIAFIGNCRNGDRSICGCMTGLALINVDNTDTLFTLFLRGQFHRGQNHYITKFSFVDSNIYNTSQSCLNDQSTLSILLDSTGISLAILGQFHGNIDLTVTTLNSVGNGGQAVGIVGSDGDHNIGLGSSTLTQRRHRSGSGRQLIGALLPVVLHEILADTAVNNRSQLDLAVGRLICQIESVELTVVAQECIFRAVILIGMAIDLSGAGNRIGADGSLAPGTLCGPFADIGTPQEFLVIINGVLTDALSVVRVVVDSFLGVDGCALLLIIGHRIGECRSVGVIGCQVNSNGRLSIHHNKLTANDVCLISLGLTISQSTVILNDHIALSVHIVIQRCIGIVGSHGCNGRILYRQSGAGVIQGIGRTLKCTAVGGCGNRIILTECRTGNTPGVISALAQRPDLVAQVEVNGAIDHCDGVGQTGILLVIDEVLYNCIFHGSICTTINITGAIIKQNGSIFVRLGGHIQRTGTVILLIILFFVNPVVRIRHGTHLQLVLLLHIHAAGMQHIGHIQTAFFHLIHINVDGTVVTDHTAVSRRVAAGVHIVPVGAVIIDLADGAGEPGVFIAGIVVHGLGRSLSLYIVGMGCIVRLRAGINVIRRNHVALAIVLNFVDITVIQRINVVDRRRPHLAHGLGGDQEVAVVDSAFAFNAVLGDTFHIDVVIAGIHIEPIAHHLIVGIGGSGSILDLNRIEVVDIVKCTAAKAFAGNGSLSSIGIEHDLVEVNDVAAVGIDLCRSTPLTVFGVDLRECSLDQICIGCCISQTDTAVISAILNCSQLVTQNCTEGGHLDGVIAAAGIGDIQHGTHVEHSVFSQPVMDHQHLVDISSSIGQCIHFSHGCITHCQQFAAVVINIGHECLGQHLHQLDHLCRRNVLIGIQITQDLQSSHGAGLSVLGSPVVGGNAKILSMVSIECRQHRIVICDLGCTVVHGVGGVHTDDLDIAVGIQDGITLLVHHISGDPVTVFIGNHIAVRSDQRTVGIVHIETDLHIGVEQIVFIQSLALCRSGSFANIAGNGFVGIQIDPNILSHGQISKLIFLSLGIIHDHNILTACRAVERDLSQLVIYISEDTLGNRAVLRIVQQTTVGDSLSIILSYVAFAIQELTLLVGTELRSIILRFHPGIIHNTGTGGELHLINDGFAQSNHVSNIDLTVAVQIGNGFDLFVDDLIAQCNNITNVVIIVFIEVADHLRGNGMHGAGSFGIRIQQRRMTGDGIAVLLLNRFNSGSNRDFHIQLGQFFLHGFHGSCITFGNTKADLGYLIINSGKTQVLNCIIQIVLVEDLVHELGHIFLAQAVFGNINRTAGKFLFQVSGNGSLDRVIGHFRGLFHRANKGLVGLFLSLGNFHCTKLFNCILDQSLGTCKRMERLRRYAAGLNRCQTGSALRSGCGSRNGRCNCRKRQQKGYANR